MDIPKAQYARAGELSIAYTVAGKGPLDIVYCSNLTSHAEAFWDWAPFARLIRRLATLGRVILFDLPGNGLSDPVSLDHLPGIEQWMDYVRVVMDAAGAERAVLFGQDGAGGLAIPFAATHPDRVSALVLCGSFARVHRADGYPFGIPEELRERGLEWWLERWGTGRQLELTAPSLIEEPYEVELIGAAGRYSASHGVARAFFRLISEIDVRDLLPAVHVATLVMHRTGDRWIRVEHGRYLAERIEGARFVELDGDSYYVFYGDMDAVLRELRSFLDTLPEPQEANRMLATILFTDIVASTERAAELGDRRWRALLDEHDTTVRAQLARFRGKQIRSTGDGMLATFDGAARAVRAAAAIREALRPLDLRVRAGLHTGEVELRDGGPDGIAVHIAARVAALADGGEVLVSQTVKDLTVGSGLVFEPPGSHALKGVPGEWQTYALAG
jgi:class 3 adenylate cyclase/alpha-beta hydrolase superfamily lysophospholipase